MFDRFGEKACEVGIGQGDSHAGQTGSDRIRVDLTFGRSG